MAKKSVSKTEENVIEMTKQSHAELVQELENRKTEVREKIAQDIADARELGDLSENYAYSAAMEQRELNENRIDDLEELLKNVHIVEKAGGSSKIVTIGKSVQITSKKNNKSREVTLAGSQETEAADPTKGLVSIDSPIGKAIHNASIGDTVEVELPIGIVEYTIDKFIG